jgi:hypothetical protein
METLKPGTRCECCVLHLGHPGWCAADEQVNGTVCAFDCGRKAARIANIAPDVTRMAQDQPLRVPMCAACAAYHESETPR